MYQRPSCVCQDHRLDETGNCHIDNGLWRIRLPERLPELPKSADRGVVYVIERDGLYKIGFTRNSLTRRIRDIGGRLVLTIETKQRPSVLETILHQRFRDKRVNGLDFRREWFRLDTADLDWLRGLGEFVNHS